MPSPFPSPVIVQLAPDVGATVIAIVSALIALLAAGFTAYAAFQAARAAKTARDAYLTDATDRRIRQAQHVHAQITDIDESTDDVRLTLGIQNTSDGFIFDVDLRIAVDGAESSVLERPVFSNGHSLSDTTRVPRAKFGAGAVAVLRFTDYAGVRWERRGSNPPTEIIPS